MNATSKPRSSSQSKKIQLNKVILEIHPQMNGPDIGENVKKVTNWMKEEGLENTAENLERIKIFIKNL